MRSFLAGADRDEHVRTLGRHFFTHQLYAICAHVRDGVLPLAGCYWAILIKNGKGGPNVQRGGARPVPAAVPRPSDGSDQMERDV
jgi:hypothetical protein